MLDRASPRGFGVRLSLLILCIACSSAAYAQGQSGICHVDCLSAMRSCLASTPGCRSSEGRCRDGSQCRNGSCPDGTSCPRNWSAECSPCYTAHSDCLLKCPETWLPELFDVTLKAKLDPAVEVALRKELEAAQRALRQGVAEAVLHLSAYQTLVRAQMGKKTISQATATALEEVARRSAATLQSKALPACATTLTIGAVAAK